MLSISLAVNPLCPLSCCPGISVCLVLAAGYSAKGKVRFSAAFGVVYFVERMNTKRNVTVRLCGLRMCLFTMWSYGHVAQQLLRNDR